MTEPTFREASGTLKKHADTLRNQQEPNIDDLLNIVQESVEAFKICQQRINDVEAALQAALGDNPLEGNDDEDDVPF
jgi:exodeoxyribonuclease VII small subunit